MKKSLMKLGIVVCTLALSAALVACANQAPAADTATEATPETEVEATADGVTDKGEGTEAEKADVTDEATADKADETTDAAATDSESEANEAAGASTEEAVVEKAEAGLFESDEQCLSCHGGSYEALAETTAEYGLSNPHNSIHGGYNSCVNCHAKDKEITDNKCDNCHSWPHNPETGMGVALATAPQ